MSNLISKDEDLKSTPVYIGFLILKIIKQSRKDKISIFEVMEKLKKDIKIIHYRQIVFSLMFLHSSGVIDFTEPYLYKI